MKKILLLFLIFLLTGCSIQPNFGGGTKIVQKEIILSGEKVEIGNFNLGANSTKFKPEVKLNKWGDEASIVIGSDDEVEDKAFEKNNKIISKTKDGKREFNFYTDKVNNKEVFEYEVILNEKPDINIITLNIDLSSVECAYQLPMNEDPSNIGLTCTKTECFDKTGKRVKFRLENIIGTYACYGTNKIGDYSEVGGKNYMAGKIGNFYKPELEDSNGWKVFGTFNRDMNSIGKLEITIPQDFLDKAVYPIKKAAGLIFGYETEAGSYNGLSTNVFIAYRPITEQLIDAEITAVDTRAFLWGFNATSAFKGVIALQSDDNNASIISNGIGDALINGTGDQAWYVSEFSTQPTLAANTAYWLGIVTQDPSGDNYITYDGGITNTGRIETDNNYGSPTNPSSVSVTTDRTSIYITYTEGGEEPPAATPTTPQSIILFD